MEPAGAGSVVFITNCYEFLRLMWRFVMLPSNVRPLAIALAAVVAVGIPGAEKVARAQNVSPRGIGSRLRDDVPPTQAVKGKLVEAQRNGFVIESDGKKIPIGINTDTVVELGAKGPVEFLRMDSIVVISGELQTDGTVSLRDNGWSGVEVCVTGQPPAPQADRGYEVTYTAKAGSAVLPFKFVGSVINLDPLVVKPLSNYRQPTLAVENPGQPLQKLPDIKNRQFTIEVPKEKGMLRLNLGNRMDLIGPDAQVTANVALLQGRPIATRVYIERTEPFKSEEIPADAKDAKGKKKVTKGSAKKSTKSGTATTPKTTTAPKTTTTPKATTKP